MGRLLKLVTYEQQSKSSIIFTTVGDLSFWAGYEVDYTNFYRYTLELCFLVPLTIVYCSL